MDDFLQVTIDKHTDRQVVERPELAELELDGLRGPLATITWLDSQLRRRWGQGLKSGDFVLAATPGGMIPLHAGSHVSVEWIVMEVECEVE